VPQNDGDCHHDAGNSFDLATPISPGSYTGILCYSDPQDYNDYYSFSVTSGQSIYVSMTPPYYGITNFDLQLYDPGYNLKAESFHGRGMTDSVFFIADSTGNWVARIYLFEGEAQYSFCVSVSSNACAMKTKVDGYFYLPNVTTNLLKVEMLFSNSDIEGDQTGNQTYPYWQIPTIQTVK
jgi:hypothetical protein